MDTTISKSLILFCLLISFSTIQSTEINSLNVFKHSSDNHLKTHQIKSRSTEEVELNEKDVKKQTIVIMESESNKTEPEAMELPMESRTDSESNQPKGRHMSYEFRSDQLSANDVRVGSDGDENMIPVYRETLSGYPAMTMYDHKSPLDIFYRKPTPLNNQTNNNDVIYSFPEVSHNDQRNYFRPIVPMRRRQFSKSNEDDNQSGSKSQVAFTHEVKLNGKGFHRSYYMPSHNIDSDYHRQHDNLFPNDNKVWKSATHHDSVNFGSNKEVYENTNPIRRPSKSMKTIQGIPYSTNRIRFASNTHPISSDSSFSVTSSPIAIRNPMHLPKEESQNSIKLNYDLETIKRLRNRLKGIEFFRPMPWFPAIHPLSREPWVEDMPVKNYDREIIKGQSSNDNIQSIHKKPKLNNNIVRNRNNLKTQFGRYETIRTAKNIPNEFYPDIHTLLPDNRFFKVGATLKF